MTAQPNHDQSAAFVRNIAVGSLATFLGTTALLAPGVDVGPAAAISLLPSLFAGPFVGGLYTLLRHLAAEASAAKAAEEAAVVVENTTSVSAARRAA